MSFQKDVARHRRHKTHSECRAALLRTTLTAHIHTLINQSINQSINSFTVSQQCYFSCDFLVIVIVKVIIFQVFQLQF